MKNLLYRGFVRVLSLLLFNANRFKYRFRFRSYFPRGRGTLTWFFNIMHVIVYHRNSAPVKSWIRKRNMKRRSKNIVIDDDLPF